MSSDLLLLTAERDYETVVPSLALLPHSVRTMPLRSSSPAATGAHDLVLVDARVDLVAAREVCRSVSASESSAPVVAVVSEGGLVALHPDWGVSDMMLCTAGPAEADARVRLLVTRQAAVASTEPVAVGDLVIEEETYTAKLRGRPLELTYKEFELLKYLTQHAGRVFTRVQLLQEVWGYDFFGGTRTVDVHIRRLRAKLGPEYEAMIGTVRNVGYKFVRPTRGARGSVREQMDRDEAEVDAASEADPAAAEAEVGVIPPAR